MLPAIKVLQEDVVKPAIIITVVAIATIGMNTFMMQVIKSVTIIVDKEIGRIFYQRYADFRFNSVLKFITGCGIGID